MGEENITIHMKWEQRFLKQPHALLISDKSNPNELNLNVPDSQTSTARPSDNPPLANFDEYITKEDNIFNGSQFLLDASQLEWGVRWHLSGFDHYTPIFKGTGAVKDTRIGSHLYKAGLLECPRESDTGSRLLSTTYFTTIDCTYSNFIRAIAYIRQLT